VLIEQLSKMEYASGSRNRGVIKIKVRVKLGARLLLIAWALMKKKEPYRPDYLLQTQ
jgi:hypothetical protein